MEKSTGTPPSLEEKKALPNCGNKYLNIINVLNSFSTSVATVLKCMKWLYHMHKSLVFGWYCSYIDYAELNEKKANIVFK